MVIPTAYPLSILVDGNEVITFTPFDSLDFDDNARTVSYFRMTVENPTVTPARNDTVVISSSGTTIFDGFIIELTSKKRDNGLSLEYDLECADKKILLQRSIMDYNEFAGSDADILTNLLNNAYPDLTSDFDFSTGVTSFLSDMALTTNNESLLDSLNNLSDLAGGAAWRFDTGAGASSTTVDFDSGYGNYDTTNSLPHSTNFTASEPSSGGNPDAYWKGTEILTDAALNGIVMFITLPSETTITNITFDLLANATCDLAFQVANAPNKATPGTSIGIVIKAVTADTWASVDMSSEASGGDPFPFVMADGATLRITLIQWAVGVPTELGADNIKIFTSGGNSDALQWDDIPDPTAFDFDIQAGDEFAFDIDLFEGDFDDFNSITVVGGNADVPTVWIYESRGEQEHFDLELPVKDIVVEKNTGTDGTPIWTAQAVGTWGTDELTSDGGSKDVLYDVDRHWLLFDTNPTDLAKSFRVSGTIKKPVRVRVEDVNTGDPTYATVVHDDTITSQDEAVSVADSMLQERNSLRRMTFSTYEPGLKPGQSILVADSARGLSETLTISNIKTKWIGNHAIFNVTCGDDREPNAAIMIANNDKRSRRNTAGGNISTLTTSFVVDVDGTRVADVTGDIVYEAI